MSDTVYKDLIGALAMRGGAAPAFECPEVYELLEELYTPEEAKLACQMPVGAVSTADLVSSTGRDLEEVERLIDSMCNKGLAIGRPRGCEPATNGSVFVVIPEQPTGQAVIADPATIKHAAVAVLRQTRL